MAHDREHLPLVYSCSGCSSAAQMANHLALRLDREGRAEMSCIAGVGGGVGNLVRKAKEAEHAGRSIIAIDGCVLACTNACLGQRDIEPTMHVQLSDAGVRKAYHADFDPEEAERLYTALVGEIDKLEAPEPRRAGGCGGGTCGCG